MVVLELKRNQTPRDVVAQALEYGQWVRTLGEDELAEIFEGYQSRKGTPAPLSLDEAFQRRFGRPIPGELNKSHQLIIVAAELDAESERIVQYLAESYGVPVNVVFFNVFKDEGREYLSRAWLVDPDAAALEEPRPRATEPWNGETYVSFGFPPEAVNAGLQYGFICAGGGRWYSNGLGSLEPGQRVWVNRVGGYVGVAVVESQVPVPADDFSVRVDGRDLPVTHLDLEGRLRFRTIAEGGADMADYFVRVNWIAKTDFDSAVMEKGFFGNQNTVARPRAASWQHTIDRLKARWSVELGSQ